MLIRELRSHMLHSMVKIKKRTKQRRYDVCVCVCVYGLLYIWNIIYVEYYSMEWSNTIQIAYGITYIGLP